MKKKRTAAIVAIAVLVILAGAVFAFAISGTTGPKATDVPRIESGLPTGAPAAAEDATEPAEPDAAKEQTEAAPPATQDNAKPAEDFSDSAEDAAGSGGDSRETVPPGVRDETPEGSSTE
jgi:hypothetical protein